MIEFLPVLILLPLLLIAGGSFFAALLAARRERRELEARVDLAGHRVNVLAESSSAPSGAPATGWSVELGVQLRGWFSILLSHTWGMQAGPLLLCLMAFGGASGTWLLLRNGLHLSFAIAGTATFAAFFFAPRLWLKREQKRSDQQFVSLFPDTIDMMIRMLRAGMPVTAAIRAVGMEAPPPVNLVFAHIADEMQIGISFEDALASAAEQVGLPDFRFFAVSIALQRTTGGNLTVTLDILSEIMRKRRAMRLKGRAITGEVRMSAYVLAGIPAFVIGALVLVSPDYLLPLIQDRRGNIIIGVAVLSMTIGFAIIRQMLRSVTQA